MIVETATIYALFSLFLVMLTVTVYFAIFFFIFAVIAWGIRLVFRPIMMIFNY
jgi:hypothetical protein